MTRQCRGDFTVRTFYCKLFRNHELKSNSALAEMETIGIEPITSCLQSILAYLGTFDPVFLSENKKLTEGNGFGGPLTHNFPGKSRILFQLSYKPAPQV